MPNVELRIPPPLPEPPLPLLAVGHHASASVDAEDFSRKLGNWGNASQLIGERWEHLAADLLERRLPWSLPLGGGHTSTIVAILRLDADDEIGGTLQRAGVSAPDLLLVGFAGGPGAGLLLRAADCKVSLDTAAREQTAPARLQATFGRVAEAFPAVAGALRRQAAGVAGEAGQTAVEAVEAALRQDWQCVLAGEGLFVAPDNGFNRWFLAQLEARRRTGAPLGRLPASGPRRPSKEARGPVDQTMAARLHLPSHLEPVDAREFLGLLPGWPEALVVAALDGVSPDEADLAVLERCWRVAAGMRGATLALNRRLFHPALPSVGAGGRPADVSPMLRRVISRRRPRDSAELLEVVSRSVDARRPLWERETAVLRAPLSFAAWSAEVGEAVRARQERRRRAAGAGGNGEAAGAVAVQSEVEAVDGSLPAPAGAPAGGDGSAPAVRVTASPSARVLYREITDRHRERLLAAAAELERLGHDEVATLEALEARAAEWNDASRADAAAVAAAYAASLSRSEQSGVAPVPDVPGAS